MIFFLCIYPRLLRIMWWMMFKCFVLAITVTMFASNVYVCNAEPSPGNNEMYRELMKLDQLYSSIARPRQFEKYTDITRSGTKGSEGDQYVTASGIGQPVFTPIEA
ncbi:hypothetical protein ABEB36_000936 [Hypothenemus hampei]|uniref:Uncharacterized protein n=1 Tax=Hypothenemus hampei TaxID=57062 RepID=A0ABD1FCW2_HYPHA